MTSDPELSHSTGFLVGFQVLTAQISITFFLYIYQYHSSNACFKILVIIYYAYELINKKKKTFHIFKRPIYFKTFYFQTFAL